MSNPTLTIGNYSFSPVPSDINISKEYIRTDSGSPINSIYTATLNGVLFYNSCSDIGISTIINQQSAMRQSLCDCEGCVIMQLECSGTELIHANVKVQSLEFQSSTDNWVLTSPYTLVVTWDAYDDLSPKVTIDNSGVIITDDTQLGTPSGCYPYIRSIDESWDLSSIENYNKFIIGNDCSGNAEAFTVTHNLSARGVDSCDLSGVVTPGWEHARSWVVDNLKCTPDLGVSGGVFGNLSLNFYNLKRSQSYNRTTGDFSVEETWTALTQDGSPRCLEEFSVDCSESNSSNITTYTINGSITGFESRDCAVSGYNLINKTKIESAKECWSKVQGQLINRINCLASPSGCSVNSNPLSKSVTFNPLAGTVNYNYSYTDRFQFIPNAKQETINISDVLPSEQIATTPVIGRVSPLIERSGAINILTKSVSISAVLPKINCNSLTGTNCSNWNTISSADASGVTSLLCCIQNDLESNYDNVIVTSDTSNYNPIEGVYQRNVTWTLQNCSQNLPDICGS